MASEQYDEQAVSPVIATVLLLAITVILSSMVYLMMTNVLLDTEKAAPQVTHSVKGLDNGHHVVKFVSIDQSLDPSSVQWRLIPMGGNMTDSISGTVADEDVYGVVGANVTYHDRDAGYTVSAGDYFVINSEELGSDSGGWQFTVIDSVRNTVLIDTTLPAIE